MAENNEKEHDENSEILELLVKHLEKSSLNDLLEKDNLVAAQFHSRTWFKDGNISGLQNVVNANQMSHPQNIQSPRSVEALEHGMFIGHAAHSLPTVSVKSEQLEGSPAGNPGQTSTQTIFQDNQNNLLENYSEMRNHWRPNNVEIRDSRLGWNHVQSHQLQDTQTLAIGMQQTSLTYGSRSHLLSAQDQSFSTRPQYKRSTSIWLGILEWQEKKQTFKSDDQLVYSFPCHILKINKPSSSICDIVEADKWPSKLLMQMIPQHFLPFLGPLIKKSCPVVFHFDNNDEATKSLNRILANGFAGWIQFINSDRPYDVQIIMLLYRNKKNIYVGLIPKDSSVFLQAVRRIIIQYKQAQQLEQQTSEQAQLSKQSEDTPVRNPDQTSNHLNFQDNLNNTDGIVEMNNQWKPDDLKMNEGHKLGWDRVQNQQQQQMPLTSHSQDKLLLLGGQVFSPDPQYKNVTAIWFGALEWQERKKPTFNSDATFVHLLPCYVMMINTASTGDKVVKADNWPSKLLMQMIPQQLIASLSPLVRNSTIVSFHFDNSNEAAQSLSRILASGFAGCIHVIHSARPSDVRIILLLYNKKSNVHVGLIPKDQNGFVQAIRRVIIHHKQAQQHRQQTLEQAQKSQLRIQQWLQDADHHETRIKEQEQHNQISEIQKQLLQQKHQQLQQHQMQQHHLSLLEQQQLLHKHQEELKHEQQEHQQHLQLNQQHQLQHQQQHLQQEQQHLQMQQQQHHFQQDQQHLQQELQHQLHQHQQQLRQQQHLQQEQQHQQIQQHNLQQGQQQHLQQHEHLQQQHLHQKQQLQQLHQQHHQLLQQEQQKVQQLLHHQQQIQQQTNIQQQHQQSIESNQLCQLFLNQQQALQLSQQQQLFTHTEEMAWPSTNHQESMTSIDTQPSLLSLEQWKQQPPYTV